MVARSSSWASTRRVEERSSWTALAVGVATPTDSAASRRLACSRSCSSGVAVGEVGISCYDALLETPPGTLFAQSLQTTGLRGGPLVCKVLILLSFSVKYLKSER